MGGPDRRIGGAGALTRSAKGESSASFTADGDILFVSARADSEADEDDDSAQLWLLPATVGEARPVTRLAGGVGSIAAVAQDASRVVLSAELLPGGESLEAEAKLRALRKKKKVSAILHESYPVRFWDHDLGPAEPHLLALDLSALADTVAAVPAESDDRAPGDAVDEGGDAGTPIRRRCRARRSDARPGSQRRHRGRGPDPDGTTLVAALRIPETRDGRFALAAIDVATGERTWMFDEAGVDFEAPAVSHDGRTLAYLRSVRSTPAGPTDIEVWVSDIDGGNARRIATEWDRWASSLVFAADDAALIATADSDGRGPVFRLPLDGGAAEQLTHDDFTYTHVSVDRSTGGFVALRSNWVAPAHPVRIAPDGSVTPLVTPAVLPVAPGSITEVDTTAEDGARVRGWLLLPRAPPRMRPPRCCCGSTADR